MTTNAFDPRDIKTPDVAFVDRRRPASDESNGIAQERRQFSDSYGELSPDARELAYAIDQYKILHRRRFITYEEMLAVVQQLGYHK